MFDSDNKQNPFMPSSLNMAAINKSEITEKNRVPFSPINHVLVEVTETVYNNLTAETQNAFNSGFDEEIEGKDSTVPDIFGSGVIRKLPPAEYSEIPVVVDGKVLFPPRPRPFNLEINDKIYFNFDNFGANKRYMEKEGRYYLFLEYYEILCVLTK